MHPYCCKKDQIEAFSARLKARQVWELIINPFDCFVFMQAHAFIPQRFCRFNSRDGVTFCGKRGRVTT
ncbi:hypothetical protein ATN84_25040 [Paramesorhizobium deserti]|uniref:Uncharacterized protein n=1 Tax=Paramesorhizobium deserti TaxID=1494590 RepID=A0A135HXF5_9HYPH|nr:hypothetical protein ATN84_25040 [Paramesorhizobium deserti]